VKASYSKEERDKNGYGDIYINAAICGKCNERICSTHRHDFVTCKCGNVSVDGGSWYIRRAFITQDYKDEIVYFDDAKVSLV